MTCNETAKVYEQWAEEQMGYNEDGRNASSLGYYNLSEYPPRDGCDSEFWAADAQDTDSSFR